MFKGLTSRAQKVLTIFAQQEAKKYHSSELQPEHILLAIFNEYEETARDFVKAWGIAIDAIKTELSEALAKQSGDSEPLIDVAPSTRTKHILEGSAEVARDLKDEYIGIKHLLIALTSDLLRTVERIHPPVGLTADQIKAIITNTFRDPVKSSAGISLSAQVAEEVMDIMDEYDEPIKDLPQDERARLFNAIGKVIKECLSSYFRSII